MAETDLTDWLSIADAAARIGCSTRTIERLGRAKKLEQRLRPQDGTPPVAVYNPEDVDRIASERRRAPAPFVVPAGSGSANGNGKGLTYPNRAGGFDPYKLAAGDELIRGLAVLLSKALHSPPSPPLAASVAESRLFLTLDEAAAISGLSRTCVRRLIRDGMLKARKDRGWKIRRKDLEAL